MTTRVRQGLGRASDLLWSVPTWALLYLHQGSPASLLYLGSCLLLDCLQDSGRTAL